MMESVSAEVLAKWTGLSSKSVAALACRGIMVRAGRGKFDLEASVRAVVTHQREQIAAAGRPTAGSAAGAARARLAAAQAEAVELRNAATRGALLDAEVVESEWKSILLAVRAGVLRLPRRAGDRLGLAAEQVRGLDEEARAVLTELAE